MLVQATKNKVDMETKITETQQSILQINEEIKPLKQKKIADEAEAVRTKKQYETTQASKKAKEEQIAEAL